MPLTSDDVLMAHTTNYTESVATCKVCGYSDKVYYDPWDHTLTECLRQIRMELDDVQSRSHTHATPNLPNSPA